MDMHLFFKGKLGREEVASAWLGTLLDHDPSMCDALFDLLAELSVRISPTHSRRSNGRFVLRKSKLISVLTRMTAVGRC